MATRGTVKAVAVGRFWKHLARQSAINGHALAQSGMTGFSCGQHGMSSAIAIVAAADIVPPTAGAARGAMMMPTTARTGSSRRSVRQNFTAVISHRERRVKRLTHSQRC